MNLGFGTGPLGNLFQAISDGEAEQTVTAAWESGIRYYDTAPHYGIGIAETRLGQVLSQHERSSYVLSTKVGRLLEPQEANGRTDIANGFDVPATHRRVWDFSASGIERSIEQSLARLRTDHVDIVLIHDPDESPSPERGLTEAYPVLHELRRQGVIKEIGVGTKDLSILESFASESDVDYLMIAGRYTLLEQPALDTVLPACTRRGIRVLNAGVFNSGLLAQTAPDETATYEYSAVSTPVLERARAIANACARHGILLPQAALAFAGAHPAVASVVVGAAKPEHIRRNAELFAMPAPPSALWEELKAVGLLRADAPVPA